MRTGPVLKSLPTLLLLMTTVACRDNTGTPPAPEDVPEPQLEPITAPGVAGIVRERLGAQRVRSFTGSDEGDSVSVMARLAGARHLLVVTVQVEGEAPISSCEDLARTAMGAGDCEVAEDGTILATAAGGPFSDDNTRGSTALAQSVNPQTGRVVHALYETYAREPALDPGTLAELVSDPGLAAETAPSVNDAGADITLDPMGS